MNCGLSVLKKEILTSLVHAWLIIRLIYLTWRNEAVCNPTGCTLGKTLESLDGIVSNHENFEDLINKPIGITHDKISNNIPSDHCKFIFCDHDGKR